MTVREVIRASLRLLTRRDRRLLRLSILAQMTTAFLDLLGVTLIGVTGALLISAFEGRQPPAAIKSALSAVGMDSLPKEQIVPVLAVAAAFLLLAKSVASALIMKQVFAFLARREITVSARLTRELFSRPLSFVQQRSTQETSAALIQAANAATVVVLGQAVIAAAEITLLTFIAAMLLFVNLPLATGSILFFGGIGFVLQLKLGPRSAHCNAERVTADIASLRAAQEAIGGYREITVADRRSYYIDHIVKLRGRSARAASEQQFLNILPKYVSEAALIWGAFTLAAVLFSTQPAILAAGTFTLFLAAATRAMPSLLRFQNAMLALRGAAGSAARTFSLADDLGSRADDAESEIGPVIRTPPRTDYPDLTPTVVLNDVGFTYPGSESPAIRGVNLSVGTGRSVALVGRTGAGKSTLADLILGILNPDEGTITIAGLPPMVAVKRWPGGIAYVPQEVMLANDSVRNNVALGFPSDVIDDQLVWEALERAHLADFMAGQENGLDTQIGERGLRLSGGQRQRIGIARALFTRPRLIVLDEATSALDAETEKAVAEMLAELEEDVTSVVVAHRLSTVRHADVVVYLEDGRSKAVGTFHEVCAQVPALQRQADLMGLRPN